MTIGTRNQQDICTNMLLPQLAQAVPDGTIDRTPSARSETSGRLNRSNDSRRFLYPRSPSGIDSQRCHVIFVQPWSLILLNGQWHGKKAALSSGIRVSHVSPVPHHARFLIRRPVSVICDCCLLAEVAIEALLVVSAPGITR